MRLLYISSLVVALSAVSAQAGTTGVLSNLPASGASDGSYGGVQLAQSCSSGMTYCSPGSYGPGGCYKMGYATCTAGLVCTGGMKACAPRNGKPAYCYKPGYGKCK